MKCLQTSSPCNWIRIINNQYTGCGALSRPLSDPGFLSFLLEGPFSTFCSVILSMRDKIAAC